MDDFMRGFNYYFGSISNFLVALLVLVIGWIIALIVANLVKKGLKKTDLDNKLFTGPSGERKGKYHSEDIISKFVFWFPQSAINVGIFRKAVFENFCFNFIHQTIDLICRNWSLVT